MKWNIREMKTIAKLWLSNIKYAFETRLFSVGITQPRQLCANTYATFFGLGILFIWDSYNIGVLQLLNNLFIHFFVFSLFIFCWLGIDVSFLFLQHWSYSLYKYFRSEKNLLPVESSPLPESQRLAVRRVLASLYFWYYSRWVYVRNTIASVEHKGNTECTVCIMLLKNILFI